MHFNKTISGLIVGLLGFCVIVSAGEKKVKIMDKKSYNKLSRSERNVLLKKGTEPRFSGKYNDFFQDGTYICRQCNAPLYNSSDKFKSSCGWPSFDDEIKGAIKHKKDADGKRIEILCNNCGGHLGHIFKGEGYTEKNVRHCVNSISMDFVPEEKKKDVKKEDTEKNKLKKAYFAGGCFWGVEYFFEQKEGVKKVVSGYMGGTTEQPTYEQVCKKDTGHVESVEVTYDPEKIAYEDLTKYFFEIHNPTQADGQGPDKGPQYLSVVFYNNDEEKKTSEKLIEILKEKGYKAVTKVLPAKTFWKAEEYHQDYYHKTRKTPYCHAYHKRF